MDTISPIPLAAASWDLVAIKKIGSNSRRRSCSGRIELDFAPMVDVARDARWGRVMEGAGEDPFRK
jgi:beta-glucosidase